MTIYAGVIGLGIVSNRIIAQFKEHEEIQLAAVCDVDETRVQNYTQNHSEVAGFTDYHKVIEMNHLDLVYVATPPAFHAEIVTAAMEAGKHVLCEKPLANDMEEAAKMLEAAQASDKVHALHFPLQYSDAMYEFEHLYHSGYLGELRRIEVVMQFPQWPRPWQQNAWVGGRKQGGYTLEVGVHFIQSIQRIFGPITDIAGTMTYPKDENACEIAVLATGKLAFVRQTNNVEVLFNGFSGAGGRERVELNAYGTKGTISLQNWGKLLIGKLGEELTPVQPAHQTQTLMHHLIQAIHGKPAVLCDFQVGYDAQRVLESLRGLA